MSNPGGSSSIRQKPAAFTLWMIVAGILSIAILLTNTSPASAVAHTKENASGKQASQHKKESSKKQSSKDKQNAGKTAEDYLTLAPIAVALQSDGRQKLRVLELEVWVKPRSRLDMAMIRSTKKNISSTLPKDFSSISWDMFTNPRRGPELAKRVVTNTVNRVSGGKVTDVFIKNFVLR